MTSMQTHGSWLRAADGILVPGGFGHRGVEGKILAANYARTNGVPYFGICLGLQVAAIEFARNVLGMEGSTSTEFDEDCPNPAVIFMPEISTTHLGGTMWLGSRPTLFQVDDCKVKRLYGGSESVDERHRHRYEVNPELIERLEAAGLTFVGKDETGQRCEILELPDHPYFVAVQYHPEFVTARATESSFPRTHPRRERPTSALSVQEPSTPMRAHERRRNRPHRRWIGRPCGWIGVDLGGPEGCRGASGRRCQNRAIGGDDGCSSRARTGP